MSYFVSRYNVDNSWDIETKEVFPWLCKFKIWKCCEELGQSTAAALNFAFVDFLDWKLKQLEHTLPLSLRQRSVRWPSGIAYWGDKVAFGVVNLLRLQNLQRTSTVPSGTTKGGRSSAGTSAMSGSQNSRARRVGSLWTSTQNVCLNLVRQLSRVANTWIPWAKFKNKGEETVS